MSALCIFFLQTRKIWETTKNILQILHTEHMYIQIIFPFFALLIVKTHMRFKKNKKNLKFTHFFKKRNEPSSTITG